jgi:hypothetical protein
VTIKLNKDSINQVVMLGTVLGSMFSPMVFIIPHSLENQNYDDIFYDINMINIPISRFNYISEMNIQVIRNMKIMGEIPLECYLTWGEERCMSPVPKINSIEKWNNSINTTVPWYFSNLTITSDPISSFNNNVMWIKLNGTSLMKANFIIILSFQIPWNKLESITQAKLSLNYLILSSKENRSISKHNFNNEFWNINRNRFDNGDMLEDSAFKALISINNQKSYIEYENCLYSNGWNEKELNKNFCNANITSELIVNKQGRWKNTHSFLQQDKNETKFKNAVTNTNILFIDFVINYDINKQHHINTTGIYDLFFDDLFLLVKTNNHKMLKNLLFPFFTKINLNLLYFLSPIGLFILGSITGDKLRPKTRKLGNRFEKISF